MQTKMQCVWYRASSECTTLDLLDIGHTICPRQGVCSSTVQLKIVPVVWIAKVCTYLSITCCEGYVVSYNSYDKSFVTCELLLQGRGGGASHWHCWILDTWYHWLRPSRNAHLSHINFVWLSLPCCATATAHR